MMNTWENQFVSVKRDMKEMDAGVNRHQNVSPMYNVVRMQCVRMVAVLVKRVSKKIYPICKIIDKFKNKLLYCCCNYRCVPTGLCGGAICAENAVCKWDQEQQVSYCHCPPEFVGDGVKLCKSIPPPCNVRNNCGLYATCTLNFRYLILLLNYLNMF